MGLWPLQIFYRRQILTSKVDPSCKCLFIYYALYTEIYTVILYNYAIVGNIVCLGCQTQVASTLTMFDIQDTILYT